MALPDCASAVKTWDHAAANTPSGRISFERQADIWILC